MSFNLNFECPVCGHIGDVIDTPSALYCGACRTKIENCCEGAPLPSKKVAVNTIIEEDGYTVQYSDGTMSSARRVPKWWHQ